MRAILDQRKVEADALERVCKGLEEALGWEVAGDAGPRKASSVLFLAQSLQRYVERLFLIEEHDGYMSALVDEHPQLSGRVEELRKEHDDIRQSTREVLHGLDVAGADGLEPLHKELKRLVEHIRRHLRKEDNLLQDAAVQDSGGEG